MLTEEEDALYLSKYKAHKKFYVMQPHVSSWFLCCMAPENMISEAIIENCKAESDNENLYDYQ